MKRLIGAFLAIVMVFSVNTHTFAAATDTTEKDYTIGEAYWDDSNNKLVAMWDEPEDKTSYKVQVYRGSAKAGSTHTTSSERYDITSIVINKGTGTYYFTVYPTKGGTSMMVTSEKIVVDSSYLSDLKEAKKNNTSNTVTTTQSIGPSASLASGSASANTWQFVNNAWYYVNSSGQYHIGWLYYNSNWYYLANNGVMATGWLKLDSTWYYLNESGAMLTGWQFINGKWYYMDSSGKLLVNTVIDNYVVDANGAWVQ